MLVAEATTAGILTHNRMHTTHPPVKMMTLRSDSFRRRSRSTQPTILSRLPAELLTAMRVSRACARPLVCRMCSTIHPIALPHTHFKPRSTLQTAPFIYPQPTYARHMFHISHLDSGPTTTTSACGSATRSQYGTRSGDARMRRNGAWRCGCMRVYWTGCLVWVYGCVCIRVARLRVWGRCVEEARL